MLFGYESSSILIWKILDNGKSFNDAMNFVKNSSLLIDSDFFIVGSLEKNE